MTTTFENVETPSARVRREAEEQRRENYLRDLRKPIDDTITARVSAAVSEEHRQRGEHWTTAQWFHAAHEALASVVSDHHVPTDASECVRSGLSSAYLKDAFSATISAQIVAGMMATPDSTAGIVAKISAEHFKSFPVYRLEEGARLSPYTKGRPAESCTFGVREADMAIGRFTGRLQFSEQDLLDQMNVDAIMQAPRELGQAAARLLPDLVFSLLLANPAMDDDATALFHTNHANYGTSGTALAQSTLDTGIQKITSQNVTEMRGGPVVLNLKPSVLLVAPKNAGNARRLNRLMWDGGESPLEVRIENRLAATGLVDPQHGTITAGSDDCWLLAAPASQRPGIVAAALNGKFTPSIRPYTLPIGEWGIGWDVCLDIGVKALDYRPFYFATGAS
jgi:hypothetical protein